MAGDTPKFDVMFVDEAQDLSLIQWKLAKKNRRVSNRFFYCRR